jgi:hypothetical protein
MNRIRARQVAVASATLVTCRQDVVDSPPALQPRRARLSIHGSLLGLLAWLQNPRTASGGNMTKRIDMSIAQSVDRPYVIGAGTFLVAAVLADL